MLTLRVLSPYCMFSAILQSNKTGSWDTIPIWDLRKGTLTEWDGTPSITWKEKVTQLQQSEWFCSHWIHFVYLKLTFKSVNTHHLPFIRVIEPLQQLNACAFPAAAAPNKRQSLPGLHRHTEALQHLGVRSCRIGKFAIKEIYFSSEVFLKMDDKIHKSNTGYILKLMNHFNVQLLTFTNPYLSIWLAYADFRNSVQQFEKLGSSSFGFGIIWSERGSSAQCCPTDHDCWNHPGETHDHSVDVWQSHHKAEHVKKQDFYQPKNKHILQTLSPDQEASVSKWSSISQKDDTLSKAKTEPIDVGFLLGRLIR